MPDTKQVIVMRKDLNMRKGKMIAQGAHASIAFLSTAVRGAVLEDVEDMDITNHLTEAAWEWMESSLTKKICVSVNSFDDLMEIAAQAHLAELEVHIITDAGLTEFGRPTVTCLAIGPDYDDKIDPITKDLPLL